MTENRAERRARPSPIPRTGWAAIGFGMLIAITAAYQQFKLPPVLPLLLDLYAYPPVLAGAFMSIFAIAGLTLSPLLGGWMHRFGLRRYIWAALGLFGIATLIALAAPDRAVVMLAARGLEGIGFAVLAIAAPTVITRSAAPHHAAIAAGLIATWIPTGQLLAVFAAAAGGADGDWRILWWFGLAGTVVAGLWMAMARPSMNAVLDPPAGVPATNRSAGTDRRQRTGLTIAATVFCLWSTQFIAFMTWLPSYLVQVHGMAFDDAVWAYAVPVAVLLIFNLITGLLLRRGAPLIGLLCVGLAIQAAVWVIAPGLQGGGVAAACLVIYGVGAGITPTCLFSLPNAIRGPGSSGARDFAWLMTGRNLGVLVGPILLARLAVASGSWTLAQAVFAVIAASTVAVALVLRRYQHR